MNKSLLALMVIAMIAASALGKQLIHLLYDNPL